MKLFFLIVAGILYVQEYASALPALSLKKGNWVGNGGLVVECPSASLSKLTPLDLAEGTGDPRDLLFPEGSVMDKVAVFIERVRRLSPERAALYDVLAENFMSHMFFTPIHTSTEDMGPTQIPSGCRILQVIEQDGLSMPENHSYFVDEDIWLRLNDDMKAVLILHEIIYFEAKLLGHAGNSSYLRKYVRAIVEDRFKDMNADQYFEFMASHYLAIEFWDDPQTKRRWMLTSRVNRDFFTAEFACYIFKGFKVPSMQEFTEAASRLFASNKAKALALDDSDLTFWAVGESRFFPNLMNYQSLDLGRTPSFGNVWGVGLCISDPHPSGLHPGEE